MADSNRTSEELDHLFIEIPTNLTDLLSETSNAKKCFVYRHFCRNLQEYLLDYSIRVTSNTPISDEVKL